MFQISFSRNSVFILALIFIGATIFLPKYWKYDISAQSESLSHGVTAEGHAWVGAEKPVLNIEEYTDYQCFQCYKMHFMLRKLITQFPNKIRLVHRHYPIDNEVNKYVSPQPYHIGSGRLALLSIAASHQGKFWQMNDLIYSELRNKHTSFDLRTLAEKTEINFEKLVADIQSQQTLKILENDIKDGLRHKISGTPTYVIDNNIYEGFIPSEIIERISEKDKK